MEKRRKFNFAIVGCGGMATWHAKEILKLGSVNIVAVVDPSAPVAAKFRKTHAPDAAVFESLQALIDRPPAAIDAVVIVTPHTLHFPQAKLSLEHGLHVLLEKPMVTSTADAYELWQLTKSTGKNLGISFQSPYTPRFGYLAAAREAETFGRVRAINGWISQGWLPLTIGTWRQDPALSGGGYMYDTGAHLLNAMMWLMNDPVVEVACFFDNLNSPVDIVGTASLKFKCGAIASLTFAGSTPTFQNELILLTDQYTIHTDAYGTRLEIFSKDRTPFEVKLPENQSTTPHGNFVAALQGDEPLRAPARYGVLLSTLMDALYESGKTGKLVKVEPVPEDLM